MEVNFELPYPHTDSFVVSINSVKYLNKYLKHFGRDLDLNLLELS